MDVPPSSLTSLCSCSHAGPSRAHRVHITYGSILTAETPDGTLRFRGRLYEVLDEHEEEHYETLKSHSLDHIESVGAMSVSEEVIRTAP